MFGFSEYGASVTVKGPKGGMNVYASVTALEKAIKAKKAKIAKMKAARKKMGFFSPRRRFATQQILAEIRFVRAMESALKAAKAAAKAGKIVGTKAIPTGAALTTAQIAAIQAMIKQATAQGADADEAEEDAKRRVLPPHLLRAVPRGFFRGVRRAGPRPALPTTQPRFYSPMPGELPGPTRSIDPEIVQRDIDPLVRARSIDPDPMVRGIDPIVGGTHLIPQAGAFTFPPGNLTDVDPDTIVDVEGLSGIVDTVKEYAQKPWVLGLAAVGAFLYFRKGKSAKKNPRHNRRRRARRNRR